MPLERQLAGERGPAGVAVARLAGVPTVPRGALLLGTRGRRGAVGPGRQGSNGGVNANTYIVSYKQCG